MALVGIGACAGLGARGEPEQNAQLRLDRGLMALDAGRYAAAFDDLAWVYSQCSGREAGVAALEGLVALELDPRNPQARPAVGTEMLGRMIRRPQDRSARFLSETFFLAALALGAPHPEGASEEADTDPADPAVAPEADDPAGDSVVAGRVARTAPEPAPQLQTAYGCGAVAVPVMADTGRALPRLPGPSMAAILASAEVERDSASMASDSLRAMLGAVQEQLAATREELERIRRTLKP